MEGEGNDERSDVVEGAPGDPAHYRAECTSGYHFALVDLHPGSVLLMTFISATIPGLLALRAGDLIWGVAAAGGWLVFAHATNNLLNDYTDYKRAWIRIITSAPNTARSRCKAG